ncbi:MAG: ABC transporter substrate-binding protein [Acidimicrobiia bacterium]|nr:ABC transporter substrate-binding protein [Acidimicrobiia bacterium]
MRSELKIAVICLLTSVIACSPGDKAPAPSALDDDAVTVGSFDFPESVVLAEIYAQALEASGYEVERALALGPREFVGPALQDGLVELVPEYAGTAAEFASLGAAEPSGDPAQAHAELVRALDGGAVTALDAAPAQVANTFAVTVATADEHGLATLSDLAPVAAELSFGGPAECAARPLCLRGLEERYGFVFDDVRVLDTGGPVTRQALRNGDVDVALLFTTDPSLGEFVELRDDAGLQPAENVTPIVRTEVVDRFGQAFVGVVDDVSRRLTTQAVRQLNAAMDDPDGEPAGIAARWLEAEGLT